MELNLLTGGQRDYVRDPYNINERDFWTHYVMLLNINLGGKLTPKEMQVFSLILSKTPEVNYFNKLNYKELKEDGLKISTSELARLKKRFLDLNLIENKDNPKNKRKKIVLPIPQIIKLQKYIKKNKKISFIFAYEIS